MNKLNDATNVLAGMNITTRGEAFNAVLSQCELIGITDTDQILILSSAINAPDHAKLDFFDILAIGILSQQFLGESDSNDLNI